MTDAKKPNCYECKHRRTLFQNYHSACAHGGTAESLGIKADARGPNGGWFSWPHNFDPVWLEACSGFTAKE